MSAPQSSASDAGRLTGPVAAGLDAVRRGSVQLVAGLSDADATVQSMPDASPAKWHLAHTTWFFEAMVLVPALPGYRVFDARYHHLFNSYYETLGPRHPRPRRGLLTRPSLEEVLDYRRHVDEALARFLRAGADRDTLALVELGCHHEQQHQELLLTDLLHLFAQNPLLPAYQPPDSMLRPAGPVDAARELAFAGGLVEVGHDGRGFGFDCEGPRHRVWLEPFLLADRLVTNGEWLQFVEDGGYRDPLLWLSEGWARVKAEDWAAPLYWDRRDGAWWTMSLRGALPLEPAAPVCHLSYYEADAYARWRGRRLPTEFEWEHAAQGLAPDHGHYADSGRLRPRAAPGASAMQPRQMFGDVWEWTSSAFTAYPRFRPEAGAVGEYNGKFMSGQYVLRGGSCATPARHLRASYRNFFPPEARWQFSGLRLAQDA